MARPVDNRVAKTGPAAITKIQAGPLQADPLDGLAAATFAGILGIQLTLTAFLAGTGQCLVAFDLEDILSAHRLATVAISSFGAHRVAWTGFPAITDMQNILTHGLLLPRYPSGRSGRRSHRGLRAGTLIMERAPTAAPGKKYQNLCRQDPPMQVPYFLDPFPIESWQNKICAKKHSKISILEII